MSRGPRMKARSGAKGRGVTPVDFVVPGDIETPTGGYIYDREIVAGLTDRGFRVAVHSLDASFPAPSPAALRAARAVFAAIPAGRIVVIDGLALPGLDRRARRRSATTRARRARASPGRARDGSRSRRRRSVMRRSSAVRLTYAQRVITTSQWTARTLAADGVPVAQLRVVEPGVDRRKTRGSSDPKERGARRRPARHREPALRRHTDAAQGARRAARSAERAPRTALAPDVRRQPAARRADGGRASASDRSLQPAQAREPARRSRPRRPRAAVRARRCVRAPVVSRRLRHGARRGRRVRAARRQHDGWRYTRDGAREREPARGARRQPRAREGACARHRRPRAPRHARGQRARRARVVADVGDGGHKFAAALDGLGSKA